ncbi:MAG: HEPN domain-containing protein [Candidatus Latescibacterota bacterium]|jgi:HEPN domain-containing protein
MNERDLQFARQWLKKAKSDLFTARCVLQEPDGPTDTPCFHAQQAVEKALKAILTAFSVHFSRTHDLLPLLDQAAAMVPEVTQYRFACAQLSAYAAALRYPAEMDEPTRHEATEALQWATAIHAVAVRFLADLRLDGAANADAGDQEE